MARKKVVVLNADKTVKLAEANEVEGFYLGFRTVASGSPTMKDSKLHIFQTAEGNLGVWGFYNLDMQLASVTPGVMTFVEYLGRSPNKVKGKQPMHLASVEIDDDLSIDVKNVVESSGSANEPDSSSEDEEAIDEDEAAEEAEEIEEPKKVAKAVKGTTSVTSEQQLRAQALLNKARVTRTA